MRKFIKLSLLTLLCLSISCDSESASIDTEANVNLNDDHVYNAKGANKQTVVIFDVVNGVEAGTSTLHRNNNGITVNFKATGLIPGHAYTVWWVIWNNPENCNTPGACEDIDFGNADAVQVELMYATGHVVGNSGKGNFGAHLNENDASGTINPLFGLPTYGGLADAQKAEVHMVLRSHGPKIPGIVNEQIGSYLGGCPQAFPYGFPPFSEIPDEAGECGDIYASIHQP
jgi:hypothetical protein